MTPKKIPLPTNLDTPLKPHALRSQGAPVADPKQLLADVRAGKLVELEVDVVAFIQRPEPNRNFTRFKPSILGKLAASYAGCPFQRNHSTAVEDRGGTILSSRCANVRGGAGGEEDPAFEMTVKLTKPWAVEGVLDGTIDRFSIAWLPTGDIECSICGEPMVNRYGFTFPACDHVPGEEYEIDAAGKPYPKVPRGPGDYPLLPPGRQGAPKPRTGAGSSMKRLCELVYTAAEGTEVSAVSVPAVVGTEIDDVRAALALARGSQAPAIAVPVPVAPVPVANSLTAVEAAVAAQCGVSPAAFLETKRRAKLPDADLAGLTPVELAICKQTGVSPADFLKTKAARR